MCPRIWRLDRLEARDCDLAGRDDHRLASDTLRWCLVPMTSVSESEVNAGVRHDPTGQEAWHARRARNKARQATTTLEVEAAEVESHTASDGNEKALRVCIIEKRQRSTTHTLAREQSWAVHV